MPVTVEPPTDIILGDGTPITLRALARDDAERLRRLFWRLSPATIHARFLHAVKAPTEACLARLTDLDLCDRYAIAAVAGDEIVGVSRYARDGAAGGADDEAEVALVVEDAWQARGLGRLLLDRLRHAARRRGIAVFTGTALADNQRVLALLLATFPDVQVRLLGREYALRAGLDGHGGSDRASRA